MINQKPIVFEKLSELKTEKHVDEVYDEGSENWAKEKILTYSEADNSPSDYADDEEYTSSLAVRVIAWGKGPSQVSQLAILAVSKMKEIGYERTMYADYENAEKKKGKIMIFEKEL